MEIREHALSYLVRTVQRDTDVLSNEEVLGSVTVIAQCLLTLHIGFDRDCKASRGNSYPNDVFWHGCVY